MSAQVHWVLGYPDKALAIGSEALALAEHVAHPLSLEFVLIFNAMLHVDRGEPELALQRVESAEALVAEQRLGFVMEPRFLRGAALSAHGAFDEAVACLRDALAGRLGAMTFRPYGFTRLAEALISQGQHGAVIAAAREGMEVQEETGALRWGAEFHRLEGIALIRLNRLEEGQIALKEALRIARKQHAKAYELRAATSLARLWGEQGRRAEARDLLAPVYGWFTEGSDTVDLKEARGLLDELT
jgi:predicted ATPase